MTKVTKRRPDAKKVQEAPKSKKKLERELFEKELGKRCGDFFKKLDSLSGKDYCDTFLSAAKHVLPSLKSVEYKDTSVNEDALIKKLNELRLKEEEINKNAGNDGV